MFCTGIENSNPTIDHGRTRIDEMESCHFYKRWREDFAPVNEMFICATFSARYGWWNEQETSDRCYVTAIKHIVKANVMAMQAILKLRPDAIFIQSESSEYFHAKNPAAIAQAEHLNALRFLPLDLNYGRRVDS